MHHLAKEFSIESLLSLTEFIQFRDQCIKSKETKMNDAATRKLSVMHSIASMGSPKSKTRLTVDIEQVDRGNDIGIQLPDSIPQSWIVYGKGTGFDDRERAHLLYLKYIKVGAALEININSADRRYYQQVLGDLECLRTNESLTEQQLMDIFVPCCQQMMVYLTSSVNRFASTPIYKRRLQRDLSHQRH